MATKESLLEKYTNSVEARNDHLKENEKVFANHERLVFATIDAENALRDEIEAETANLVPGKATVLVQNHKFIVSATPQTQRQYNEDKLKQYLTPTQFADVVNDVKRPTRVVISAVKEEAEE